MLFRSQRGWSSSVRARVCIDVSSIGLPPILSACFGRVIRQEPLYSTCRAVSIQRYWRVFWQFLGDAPPPGQAKKSGCKNSRSPAPGEPVETVPRGTAAGGTRKPRPPVCTHSVPRRQAVSSSSAGFWGAVPAQSCWSMACKNSRRRAFCPSLKLRGSLTTLASRR